MLPFISSSLFKLNTPKSKDINYPKNSLSLEEVCSLYPERIKKLFASLNLDLKHLENVKLAVGKKDWVCACKALIYYYQNSNVPNPNFSLPKSPISIDLCANLIVQDLFTFQNVECHIVRFPNGLINWSYKGTKNDREWAWFLNRHYHLLYLFDAYQKTNILDYVQCISNHITDWIITNPSQINRHIWAQWRGLEAAYRVINWSSIFYELQQVNEFTHATRILMLSSILDHAYYLRHLHAWGANWLSREMNGLATVALYWPEFKNSQKWLNYANQIMFNSISKQVYPDGVQKELTSHYHWITLWDFQKFYNLLKYFKKSVPDQFKNSLEKMWNYLAYSIRPSGYGLLNNDSDLDLNLPHIKAHIDLYQRPDWQYITTHGEFGEKPPGEPSVVFPWAGHVIMRSGWDKDAHWAFFDVGPLGINYHIHKDKLHLSITAYGRDLLVDSGRYSYVRDKFWQYFRDSASHNVILIDGKGQKGDVKEWRKPMTGNYTIGPEFDYAQGTFDGGFINIKGKATHSRTVVYLRGKYWIVVDRITTDLPRQIQPLWHFHPNCTVIVEDRSIASVDPGVGNLRIVPVSNLDWQVKIVAGEENPIQGWWSEEYNRILPNPTAIYATKIMTTVNFAWVIYPAKGIVPNIKVNLLPSLPDTVRLQVEIPEQEPDEIAISLTSNTVSKSKTIV
ncbi:MAG TPA: alginate lyase family protein [Leptolyngbyaceae cyanobacterium]